MKTAAIQKTDTKNQDVSSLFKKNEDNSFAEAYESTFENANGSAFNFGNLKMGKSGYNLRVQPKLQLNQPGDQFEQEADAMADKVMRMPNHLAGQQSSESDKSSHFFRKGQENIILRKCADCEKEDEEKKLQRKEANNSSLFNPQSLVNDALNSSSGKPMDFNTRSFMEVHFNQDFSNVRIHDNDLAAKSANSIDAIAYTSRNNIVFNRGKYSPNSHAGKRLLAHELTHVTQQASGIKPIMRQGLTREEPQSLTINLDPVQLSDAALEKETRLLTEWLDKQGKSTERTDQLFLTLYQLKAEQDRRGKKTIQSKQQPQQSNLPPGLSKTIKTGNTPVGSVSAPTTTKVDSPASKQLDFQPNEAIRKRLEEIITKGGPLPDGTRVVGAAIVEVEGYKGSYELRAISSKETDQLGKGATVTHAESPDVRSFSASKGIGNASVRGEFPFYHINDAEIKLFETIDKNMPPNARGRVSFLTFRVKEGGKIIEPIAACSSCTNATFEFAGKYKGVSVESYAIAHPTGNSNFGENNINLPGRTPSGKERPSGRRSTSEPKNAEKETVFEGRGPEIGELHQGGPSAKGEAIGAGITIAFMGINFILNLINDHIQEKRVNEDLKKLEPQLKAQREQNPRLGFLLLFYYSQIQAPEESIIRPGAVFSHIEYYSGKTLDESKQKWRTQPAIRQGYSSNTNVTTQEVWLPPIIPPSAKDIQTPFLSVALGTFSTGKAIFQDVEWNGLFGFDDEGTSAADLDSSATPQFLIMKLPSTIHYFNGQFLVDVSVPMEQRTAQSGGAIPVVNLDPSLPGYNVSAACVFPADDSTDLLFNSVRATIDEVQQLRLYTNFGKARWVRPENIKVLKLI